MTTMLPLLRNEWSKAVRRKLPYLGVLAVVVVCVLFWVATRQIDRHHQFNGWSFVQYEAIGGLSNVAFMFVAIFSAALVADERGSGTIRVVLSAPLRRWQFFTAKVLTGLAYMTLLVVAVLAISFGLGLAGHSFGVVADEAGVIYGRGEVVANLALAVALEWLCLAAVVCYGLFLSVLARNGGQAIAAAIGIGVLIEATKSVIGIQPYVFTTYVGQAWVKFGQVAQGLDYMWKPEVWWIVLVPVAWCVVFLAAGLLILQRRDLNG